MDWDGLFARVCAQTGWTWEYVGESMTLPRLKAMNAYWDANPPLQQQVAQLLFGVGGAPAPAIPREFGTLEDLKADWTRIGGGFN